MMFNSIFLYMPHLFDLWGESHEKVYSILTFTQSFIKFQRVSEIQMKRARRLLLTYLLTDQPIHRISISWLKIPSVGNQKMYIYSLTNERPGRHSGPNAYKQYFLYIFADNAIEKTSVEKKDLSDRNIEKAYNSADENFLNKKIIRCFDCILGLRLKHLGQHFDECQDPTTLAPISIYLIGW